MANRLGAETSPYLLQHRDNPVDWQPWDDEALERAKAEERPILLSIGYSACHWCHVMERESFEDDDTAAYMNEHFVPIKVDREERPDVDSIYMDAVQGMTGQGGWPLTAFLDPEGVPFYGGTYFPPEPRHGMPSFRMVMEAVVDAWENRRDEIRSTADRTRDQLGAISKAQQSKEPLREELLEGAVSTLHEQADMQRGGFGGAPKFPPASALELLLARGETKVVEITLDAMAFGGIYDQVGGGFARYSVDDVWLVPHFEKMLYDNALLLPAYLHGWQVLGHERYRRTVVETADWILREMRGPEGGFYSALDADSEGVEGKFYVWTPAEVAEALAAADRAELSEEVIEWYGASERGNFEGANILHVPAGASADPPDWVADVRTALERHRAGRVRPGLDDKRLTAWNALTVGALAEAGAALERTDYVDAAVGGAEFVLSELRTDNGRLLRTWKEGRGRLNAYLEDYAFLVEALLTLYEATLDVRWFEAARETADLMIELFADEDRGGFFTTSKDHEQLIARRKDVNDHPIPSGSSAAAYGLLRLAAFTGEHSYEQSAVSVFRLFHPALGRHPQAVAHMLRGLDFHLSPVKEVALVADTSGSASAALDELAAVVRGSFRPRVVLAGGGEGDGVPEVLKDRTAVDGKPSAYVCEHFACKAPVTEPAELDGLLSG
ncbi:MAG: thioredoxin domain-containing protein [Solirubrobacterales bacterium]